MKVVHINKKNIEREEALILMGRDFAEKRANLELKAFLKLRAKQEANKKA